MSPPDNYSSIRDAVEGNDSSAKLLSIEVELKNNKLNHKHQYDLMRMVLWVSGGLILAAFTFTVQAYMRLENREDSYNILINKSITQLEEHMNDNFILLDKKISNNTEHFNNRIYELMKTPHTLNSKDNTNSSKSE